MKILVTLRDCFHNQRYWFYEGTKSDLQIAIICAVLARHSYSNNLSTQRPTITNMITKPCTIATYWWFDLGFHDAFFRKSFAERRACSIQRIWSEMIGSSVRVAKIRSLGKRSLSYPPSKCYRLPVNFLDGANEIQVWQTSNETHENLDYKMWEILDWIASWLE